MTPKEILDCEDQGKLWPENAGALPNDLDESYKQALAVRQMRIARGEEPRGYKIGLTNRAMWQRLEVSKPLWGPIWDKTLSFCDGRGTVSLERVCQPKLEPELVIGMHATPPQNATLQDIYSAIAWIAPGFEVVQSHIAGWKLTAATSVMDGCLHAALVVGPKIPIREVSNDASSLERLLADAKVTLSSTGGQLTTGAGSNVLENPLRALHYFLEDLRACPGATDLRSGDVVTTGTWTEAQHVTAGQRWTANFSAPFATVSVEFID